MPTPRPNDSRFADRIQAFLGCRRIALVGVSRKPQHISRGLLRAFRERDFSVSIVNPIAAEIEGVPCVPSLAAIDPPPEAALILRPIAVAAAHLQECADAGIPRVWVYGHKGPGVQHVALLEQADALGLDLIPGYCPFMFFAQTGFVHRLHRGSTKLVGRYPQPSAS